MIVNLRARQGMRKRVCSFHASLWGHSWFMGRTKGAGAGLSHLVAAQGPCGGPRESRGQEPGWHRREWGCTQVWCGWCVLLEGESTRVDGSLAVCEAGLGVGGTGDSPRFPFLPLPLPVPQIFKAACTPAGQHQLLGSCEGVGPGKDHFWDLGSGHLQP